MVDNTTAAFLDVINTMSMKLKRISLPNDRMLSNDEMKFVVGGGDDVPEFEGGTLPEAVVYAPKRGGHEHEGEFENCPRCREILYNSRKCAGEVTGGDPTGNPYITNMHLLLTLGTYISHQYNK